jgi:hypothetical protein
MTVETHHRARAMLRAAQSDLSSLAGAFDRTGNSVVADELDLIRSQVAAAAEFYADAYDKLQKQALADSTANLAGLLGVAMKMDELESKSR